MVSVTWTEYYMATLKKIRVNVTRFTSLDMDVRRSENDRE